MKTFILIVLTILVITSLPVSDVKAQDTIDEYDGIPLVVYSWRIASEQWMSDENYVQLKEMGVFAAISTDALNQPLNDPDLTRFANNDLKVIPIQRWNSPNDILTYTDANYTVWEAEGTDPSKGKVTLYHSSNAELFQEGSISGVIAEGPNVPDGETIILGPGYPQNGTYRLNDDFVNYFAEYRMKIEQRTTPPPGYENDVACTLLVTNLADDQQLTESTVISREVTVSDFNGWNNWQGIQIDPLGYTLEGHTFDYPQSSNGTESYQRANCIQFKVVWTGLDYLNLYVDRIKVYDLNGFNLVEGSFPKNQIANNMVTHYINHPLGESVIGWYAIDEPPSIDNYEPFRVVDHIVDSVSQTNDWPMRLHTGFTGGNTGTYSNWNIRDTFALNNYQDVEFWLRAKPKNIQINMYNYHFPYKPTPGHPAYNPQWQTENIKYVTDYLDRINNFDTSFAFSTQSGGWYNINDDCELVEELIIPSKSQINYHVNLGLMYGAKELRCDPYFTELWNITEPCTTSFYRHIGLIDENEDTTANYNFFRYTIVPRLNGLFGKTLKKIHQTEQYPQINPATTNDLNVNYVKKIKLMPEESTPTNPPYLDLGFFNRQSEPEANYFMIVNRWYTEAQYNHYRIDFRNLTNYVNWNLRNYVDSSEVTMLPDAEGYVSSPTYTINSGDGILFSASPVVLYGGTLIADEPAGEGMILKSDMTIDNGAVLTVYGTYTAEADIIIKDGSIVYGESGKIVFSNGHKLIIEGTAAINGTASNKLTLDFDEPAVGDTENGIEIKSGGSLMISYCRILNASTGIKANLNANNVNIQNVDFDDCQFSLVNSSIRSKL